MKITIWHIFLATFLCLSIAGSGVAADCDAVKKGLKQERNMKKSGSCLPMPLLNAPVTPRLTINMP